MPSRKIPFVNGHYYHIYNRGTRKSTIFHDPADYRRWEELLYWYKTYNYKYSLFQQQQRIARQKKNNSRELIERLERYYKLNPSPVEIISYSHIPNHFHLNLKQITDNGITSFMHKLLTAYSTYYNAKYQTTGSLFEGPFKSILIHNDAQFLQLNRYIHINHIAAGIVTAEQLPTYPYTSLASYLNNKSDKILNKDPLMNMFDNNPDKLLKFTLAPFEQNQISTLEGLTLDDDFNWFKDKQQQYKQTLEDRRKYLELK